MRSVLSSKSDAGKDTDVDTWTGGTTSDREGITARKRRGRGRREDPYRPRIMQASILYA